MRFTNLLVIADESEAPEVARFAPSPEDLRNRWPALPIDQVGEGELTWLGFALGVCDEERDSVADELLHQEGGSDTFVCRVIAEFVEVLSRLDADAIPRVARQWRDPDHRRCGGGCAVALLGEMVAFARRARTAGKSVVWVCSGWN